jgi:hypothetical protein
MSNKIKKKEKNIFAATTFKQYYNFCSECTSSTILSKGLPERKGCSMDSNQ